MSEQKQQLKEWVIQNMIDIEADNLDEEKRKMFLDLVSERKDDEFMQECYTEFEKRKEEEEEEEEEEDIVFCCTGCDKQIIRNSEDHDFSKFDPENEDNWYCVSCPVPEEEEEEEEDEEEFWIVIEKLKKEPYYNGNIFESANMQEQLHSEFGYNQSISWGLSNGWIDEEEEEKKTICSACKRDFTDEVDDRSSFDEIGKIICKDCFEEEEEEEDDYGIGWQSGWCWSGCKWKWDGALPVPDCPTGRPPSRYFEEEEEVCDDCGEEDCSMDGLCCPEAIERTEKEMCV